MLAALSPPLVFLLGFHIWEDKRGKPLETVTRYPAGFYTALKRGVNGSGLSRFR